MSELFNQKIMCSSLWSHVPFHTLFNSQVFIFFLFVLCFTWEQPHQVKSQYLKKLKNHVLEIKSLLKVRYLRTPQMFWETSQRALAAISCLSGLAILKIREEEACSRTVKKRKKKMMSWRSRTWSSMLSFFIEFGDGWWQKRIEKRNRKRRNINFTTRPDPSPTWVSLFIIESYLWISYLL